jgi:hypothetical protein
MSLIKATIIYNEYQDYSFLHPILRMYVIEKKYSGYIELDYNGKVRIIESLIPSIFMNKIYFCSSKSFKQNNYKLRMKMRKYILENLKDSVISFGGESYMFGLIKNVKQLFFTNSEYIYYDHELNRKFYNLNSEGYIIDYRNMYLTFDMKYDIIINLSTLPKNIMMLLEKNKERIRKIIFITCNHKDFVKKIKLFSFKFLEREIFIDEKLKKYYSVNIFVR